VIVEATLVSWALCRVAKLALGKKKYKLFVATSKQVNKTNSHNLPVDVLALEELLPRYPEQKRKMSVVPRKKEEQY